MNQKVMILARSGAGKTTSLRKLDPKESGFINIDKKQLPFPHEGYSTVMNGDFRPDLEKSNYVETDKITSVMATLQAWEKRKDIKTIVIDTITHLITADYVNNAIGRDFKAYQRMGKGIYELLDKIRDIEKNIIVLGHIEVDFNEMGDRVVKMKSQGKMIENFEPESYFSVMLLGEVIKEDDGLRHVFRTQAKDTFEKVKSPFDFDKGESVLEYYENNDVSVILSKLNSYYEAKS